MSPLKTNQEGVIVVTDEQDTPRYLIRKDPITHHNLFYTLSETSFDEMEEIFKK